MQDLKQVRLYIAGTNGFLAHGPNSVLSMIHHAFKTVWLGEIYCSFHADMCGGTCIVHIFNLYYNYLKGYLILNILQLEVV